MYKIYNIYVSGTVDGLEIYQKKEVLSIVAKNLSMIKIDGFTILDSVGYWQGMQEKSYVIEIATEIQKKVLENALNNIRIELQQESIMVKYHDSTIKFIDCKFIREV